MAIKDKDGNVYKLRGPNPLMKTQQEWDRAKLNFINMGRHDSEVVEDERNPIDKFKEDFNVLNIGEELNLKSNKEATAVVPTKEFIDEISQEPEVAEVEDNVEELVRREAVEPVEELVRRAAVEPVVEKPKQVTLDVHPSLAKILNQRGAEYYCAPAMGKKRHVDDLYDNSYYTTQYGDQFVFDAVVLDMSDLQLQFWCVKPITVDSIVHPKTKEKGQRWWRITESEPKTGGYICRAITSDTNPDFS